MKNIKNKYIVFKTERLLIKETIQKLTTLLAVVLVAVLLSNMVRFVLTYRQFTKFAGNSAEIAQLQKELGRINEDISAKEGAVKEIDGADAIPVEFLDVLDSFSGRVSILEIKTNKFTHGEDGKAANGGDGKSTHGEEDINNADMPQNACSLVIKGLSDSNTEISAFLSALNGSAIADDCNILGITEVLTSKGQKQLFEIEVKLAQRAERSTDGGDV